MTAPRFLLDEQISPRVARVARAKGLDVASVAGSDLEEASDWEVLRSAVRLGRILVTYDVADFTVLLADLQREGVDAPGVVFVSHDTIPSRDIRGLAGALVRLAREIGAGRKDASAGLFLRR